MCVTNKVDTVVSIARIRGLVLFGRMDDLVIYGCNACVRRAVRIETAKNLLLGWWWFPLGLATGPILTDNLRLWRVAPNPSGVDQLLRQLGYR